MGHNWTNIAASPAASADGFLNSVDMKNGAYTLTANVPTFGARHVTVTRTVVDTADTPGTIVLVGKGLLGETINETITVGANGVVVPSTKFFARLTSATGVGWVVDAVQSSKDTITIGWDNQNAVATGSGTLHGIVINTTAAQTIVVTDSRGTIATIAASIAAGTFLQYDVNFSGYLRVEPGGASNITIIHSGTMPATYAMS